MDNSVSTLIHYQDTSCICMSTKKQMNLAYIQFFVYQGLLTYAIDLFGVSISVVKHHGQNGFERNLSISSRFSNFVEYRFLSLTLSHSGLIEYRSRKMGPVFVSILLTCVFLLVGKIFFNDFVEYAFYAFDFIFFSFFYSYYSK
ncbi:hypothetical protein STEG23_019517, partial [Scotinomys teguina]